MQLTTASDATELPWKVTMRQTLRWRVHTVWQRQRGPASRLVPTEAPAAAAVAGQHHMVQQQWARPHRQRTADAAGMPVGMLRAAGTAVATAGTAGTGMPHLALHMRHSGHMRPGCRPRQAAGCPAAASTAAGRQPTTAAAAEGSATAAAATAAAGWHLVAALQLAAATGAATALAAAAARHQAAAAGLLAAPEVRCRQVAVAYDRSRKAAQRHLKTAVRSASPLAVGAGAARPHHSAAKAPIQLPGAGAAGSAAVALQVGAPLSGYSVADCHQGATPPPAVAAAAVGSTAARLGRASAMCGHSHEQTQQSLKPQSHWLAKVCRRPAAAAAARWTFHRRRCLACRQEPCLDVCTAICTCAATPGLDSATDQ